MTTETHVPIAELGRHGVHITVINALRRTGMLYIDDLRTALERHDRAVAAGLTSRQYLAEELDGIGPIRLARARAAYETWNSAQPSTEDTDDRPGA